MVASLVLDLYLGFELASQRVLEVVKTATSATFLAALSYFDYKTRLLPDALVYAYLVTSILMYAVSAVVAVQEYGLLPPILYTLLSAALCTGLMYSLYKAKLVGDGDVYVALSLSLMHAFPQSYGTTLPGAGILPPPLVVLFYASLIGLAYSLVQLAVSLVKWRWLLKELPGVHKILVPLIARPVKLGDYLSGKVKHSYPVQCLEVENGRVRVSMQLLTRIDEDDCILRSADKLRSFADYYIWVSPGLPFILYMLLGFVLFMAVGDSVLLAISKLIIRGAG